MATSIAMTDRHYGHLTRDAEESMRARLRRRRDILALNGVGVVGAENVKAPFPAPSRVERTGIEPVTSGLQSRRSPS